MPLPQLFQYWPRLGWLLIQFPIPLLLTMLPMLVLMLLIWLLLMFTQLGLL